MNPRRLSAFNAVLLLLPLIFTSCVVTDFVGAYFNTYYNARRLFSEAETEVFAQLDNRPAGRNYLLLFAIQPTTRTKLLSVIEKGSKLLQYHPESNLVDDALLMIGKAYYYSDENQKAERKFREIIDGYPTGGCAVEARLLLSYAQYRMLATVEARATARQVVTEAENEGDTDILARACSVLGQMEYEDKNYLAASEYFQRAAENGRTPDQRSASYLLVADMHRRLGQYKQAEAAFVRAEEASNTYLAEYRGRIGAVRMREKQGEFDAALKGLFSLRSNSNNREFFGEIDLEIAHTYRAMGDIPAAIRMYTTVDTLYARTENSANSYFSLGDLYENLLFRYDSARTAYTKGRMEFPQAEIAVKLAQRSEYLGKYAQYKSEIAKYDSIRTLLLTPADTTRSIRPSGDSTARVGRATGDTLRAQVPLRPQISMDSVDARLATNKNEIAGLFYATIGKPDSAGRWYLRVINEHPKSSLVPRALFSLTQIYGRDSSVSRSQIDSMHREIVRRFPESEFAFESRRLLGLPSVRKSADEAGEMYARAESLMLTDHDAAAIDMFTKLARRFPRSVHSSRALYAAGWLYENRLLRPDSAIATYELLASLYPASPYALRVQPKLSEVQILRHPPQTPAGADSSSVSRGRKPPMNDDDLPRVPNSPPMKRIVPPPQKPDSPIEPKKPEGKEGPVPE